MQGCQCSAFLYCPLFESKPMRHENASYWQHAKFWNRPYCYPFIKLKKVVVFKKIGTILFKTWTWHKTSAVGRKISGVNITKIFLDKVLDKRKTFSVSESSVQIDTLLIHIVWKIFEMTNHILCTYSKPLTWTLIFPADVLQIKAIMTLADVTPKRVDALTETRTNRLTCCTFIHICKTNTPVNHFSTISCSSLDQVKKVSRN